MSNVTTTATEMTMSSREIAEVVEKRHDSVKRTIDMLATHEAISLPQSVEVRVQRTRRMEKVTEYRVNQRDSYVIVAQLSPEFTARLVDRWQELEKQVAQPQPQVPQTMADALRLAAQQAEQLEQVTSERDTILSTTTRHLTSLARHVRHYPDVNFTQEKDTAAHWLCASM